jgi:hypothetical protein
LDLQWFTEIGEQEFAHIYTLENCKKSRLIAKINNSMSNAIEIAIHICTIHNENLERIKERKAQSETRTD